MTKAYLKFPVGNISYAPKIQSRRFPAMNAAYRSDGDNDDPDGSKREELLRVLQSKIDTALATRATKEELQAISDEQKESLKGISLDALRSMVDDKTGVMPKLVEQGLEIQRLQVQVNKARDEKAVDMSTRGQIKTWLESRAYKNQEGKDISIAEEIRMAKEDNRKPNITTLELRVAASPMTVATVNSGSAPFIGKYQVEPGVNEIVRARPVFWDYITKGRTNAATYYWINKANPQGAAAFIGPGVAKPGISFTLVQESSNAKKIADSAKTTTELLQDIDGMATFIDQELRYQVMIKVNTVLMTSAGSSTEPTGIQNLSSAYTLTTVHTSNPNYMDAIRAAVAQMRSGWLQGAITVFINSIDAANMDLAKANDSGVYMLPAFVTADGRTIAGATIVEDNNVPVGYLQAAMLQYYRILIYQDFTVTWGWENDDFTKNLLTAVGEMRLHQFFNDQYTGAFLYDSFANIQAALEPEV